MVGLGCYCCVEGRRPGPMPERSGVVLIKLYFGYMGIFVIWSYPGLLSIQIDPKSY